MRTDLAKEAMRTFPELSGVTEQIETEDGMETAIVSVKTRQAAARLDKPIGTYISVTLPEDGLTDRSQRGRCAKVCAKYLETLLPQEGELLIIGLGNRYITADALGTKTAESVLVTRHLFESFLDLLPHSTRCVSAFCTGVLGVTGMETIEVVSALTHKIRPNGVVVIDSLAAGEIAHLGTVLQMNDTGISPGAGIGNFQPSLNKISLGVPVIAIGMPLVVSAPALISEASGMEEDDTRLDAVRTLCVTPKDIDLLVQNASKLLSDTINLAVHQKNVGILQNLLQ